MLGHKNMDLFCKNRKLFSACILISFLILIAGPACVRALWGTFAHRIAKGPQTLSQAVVGTVRVSHKPGTFQMELSLFVNQGFPPRPWPRSPLGTCDGAQLYDFLTWHSKLRGLSPKTGADTFPAGRAVRPQAASLSISRPL